jgi:hypothetical protein
MPRQPCSHRMVGKINARGGQCCGIEKNPGTPQPGHQGTSAAPMVRANHRTIWRPRLQPAIACPASRALACVALNVHAHICTRAWAAGAHRVGPGDGLGVWRNRVVQKPCAANRAGDASDARRLEGFGEAHRRQEGGGPPGQHRLARARGACRTVVMIPLYCNGYKWTFTVVA